MASLGMKKSEIKPTRTVEAIRPVEQKTVEAARLDPIEHIAADTTSIERLDRANRIARQSFEKARLHLLEGQDIKLDDGQRQRITDMDPSRNIAVVDDRTMREQVLDDVLGYYDGDCCYIREAPDDELRRCATHEAMHSLAYQEKSSLRSVSGIRVVEYANDGTGDRIEISCKNEGINEVLTERFTYQELQRQVDKDALWPTNLYLNGATCGHALESAVGSGALREAYFNGRLSELEAEFDRRAGEAGAWKRFSEDVDIVVYSTDEYEVSMAEQRIGCTCTSMLNPTKDSNKS